VKPISQRNHRLPGAAAAASALCYRGVYLRQVGGGGGEREASEEIIRRNNPPQKQKPALGKLDRHFGGLSDADKANRPRKH